MSRPRQALQPADDPDCARQRGVMSIAGPTYRICIGDRHAPGKRGVCDGAGYDSDRQWRPGIAASSVWV